MKKLSDAEWKIMEVLWEKGPCRLKEIVDELYSQTKWTRNTVHTYLTRMEKKNFVSINREQEHHLYSYMINREECVKEERERLLHQAYQGSVSDLVVAFLKESKISKEEKERLSKLLDEMEV